MELLLREEMIILIPTHSWFAINIVMYHVDTNFSKTVLNVILHYSNTYNCAPSVFNLSISEILGCYSILESKKCRKCMLVLT